MRQDKRGAEQYAWFSDFLEARGLALGVRLLLAATAFSMAASVLVLLVGAGGPEGRPQSAMMWLSVAGGIAGTVLWLSRWPTHRQSVLFSAVTSLSVALACLAYPDPLAGVLGCIAFTTLSAYLAFFHSTRLVLANLVVAFAVATTRAVDVAADGRIALAAVDTFLVVQANIALPLAVTSLLRALRGDLANADLDPLTGLLNRRAFRQQAGALLARSDTGDGYLVVAMIDLDAFKSLNDEHGHAAGDRVLVAVADALRADAAPGALVARAGGEEFLVADVSPSPHAVRRFENVVDVIAALPVPVSASVGTAFASLRDLSSRDHDDVLDGVITAADLAMYRAKRNGGNQCHHHGNEGECGR